MPNPNPLSMRMTFQWKWFETAHPPGSVLNIGCAMDPLEFGNGAHHFDIDDWGFKHERFTLGDAHHLPFDDRSFDVVVMGDIHEHLVEPVDATREAMRVSSRLLVMTIFEEWKLPGVGRWIVEGAANGDQMSQKLGYADRMDYQRKVFPEMGLYDDDLLPHLIHIWQFDDDWIDREMLQMLEHNGWSIIESLKAAEAVDDGRTWFNYLICAEKPHENLRS